MPEHTLRVEVAVPDRRVLDVEASEVLLPLTTGYLGVLPGHAPMLGVLGTGLLEVGEPGGAESCLAVDGGAVEILPDHVRVLANRAEVDSEIDRERADRALERANERLQLQSLEIDVDRAQKALERARARIAAATRSGSPSD